MAINTALYAEKGKPGILKEPRNGTYQMWTSKMPPGGMAFELSSRWHSRQREHYVGSHRDIGPHPGLLRKEQFVP